MVHLVIIQEKLAAVVVELLLSRMVTLEEPELVEQEHREDLNLLQPLMDKAAKEEMAAAVVVELAALVLKSTQNTVLPTPLQEALAELEELLELAVKEETAVL